MPEPIISLEKIETDAKAAAHMYDNVNDACPYSFYTGAGRAYKAAFQKERMAINKAAMAAKAATTAKAAEQP